jgi:hypothetical protein
MIMKLALIEFDIASPFPKEIDISFLSLIVLYGRIRILVLKEKSNAKRALED